MLSVLYALMRQKTIVALDYSDSFVKMVVLSVGASGYRLVCADSVPLERDIVVENRIIKLEEMTEVVDSLLKKHKIKNKKLGFVIPSQDTTVKLIPYDNNFVTQLTYQSDEVIFNVLQDSAEQLISYSSDDIYLDYSLVPASDDSEMIRLVGVHKERAADYQNLAEMLKMQAEVLTVDAYLLADFFREFYSVNAPLTKNECYAVIGLDQRSTQIHFLNHHDIVIQDARNLGIEISGEEYINMIVPWLMRNFQMYDVSHREYTIKKVFVYGEMAHTEGLLQSLVEYIGQLPEIVNPFEFIEILDASIEIDNPAQYLVATTLAMREAI